MRDEKKLILKKVSECTAIIGCPRYVFKEEDFNYFKKLDLIHAGGAGVEEYMKPNLKSSDIIFTNGKIIQGPEVADHALALLLYFSRNFHEVLSTGKPLNRPIEIMNKNILIIGLGGIGFSIAERLRSFGGIVDALTNEVPAISYCLNKVFYNENTLMLFGDAKESISGLVSEFKD